MSIGAILIGLALLIILAVLIGDPIVKRGRYRKKPSLNPRSDWAEQKQALMYAIRDLDFDYQSGQVTEIDYQQWRGELLSVTAEILQKQDHQSRTMDNAIENKILERREQSQSDASCSECSHPLGNADEFCSRCGTKVEERCGECGKILHSRDQFCSTCGMNIREVKGVSI